MAKPWLSSQHRREAVTPSYTFCASIRPCSLLIPRLHIQHVDMLVRYRSLTASMSAFCFVPGVASCLIVSAIYKVSLNFVLPMIPHVADPSSMGRHERFDALR